MSFFVIPPPYRVNSCHRFVMGIRWAGKTPPRIQCPLEDSRDSLVEQKGKQRSSRGQDYTPGNTFHRTHTSYPRKVPRTMHDHSLSLLSPTSFHTRFSLAPPRKRTLPSQIATGRSRAAPPHTTAHSKQRTSTSSQTRRINATAVASTKQTSATK